MNVKKSVLIVDDEMEIAEILEALLEEHFHCRVFYRASEALTLLTSTAFDFIITDIEMPDINGVMFIAEAIKISPKSRIFVSTGHDLDHPKVIACLSAGAHGIITKPYLEPDKLHLTLLNAKV